MREILFALGGPGRSEVRSERLVCAIPAVLQKRFQDVGDIVPISTRATVDVPNLLATQGLSETLTIDFANRVHLWMEVALSGFDTHIHEVA